MTHLTKQDRCKIENLLNAKVSIKKIAKDVEKHHTTVSREIKKRRVVDEASKKSRKNFCTRKKDCIKRKYFYCANNAMEEYKTILVQSRQGIDVSPPEIKIYDNLIKAGIRKGQSIHHVMAANKDIFQKCEKSLYNYFNNGYFSLPRGDMPKICMRKPRKREKITHKIDRKYRQNRTLDDYKKFKIENPDIA